MSAKLASVRKILFSMIATCFIVLLLTDRHVYESTLISPFFSVTLLAATIIHLRVQHTIVDISALVASTLIFSLVDFSILGFRPLLWANFSFIGCTSLLVLAIRSIWAAGEKRRQLLLAFVPALLFVLSDRMAPVFLGWTGEAHPKTLDLYLFHFDGSLGFQPSFAIGQLFRALPWLGGLSWLFYLGLPVPMALVYAGQLQRKSVLALPAMIAFIITGPLGVLFYNLFPALGPAHVFTALFPMNPPSMSDAAHVLLEPIQVPGLRNAIPSLHMAWVLLAWWSARGLSWWSKGIAFVFLVFTFLSTLGTGEHYLVDLIVALPFALMVQAVATISRRHSARDKLIPVLQGLGGTLLWLALLRFAPGFAWISPAMPWLLTSLTLILCLGFERRYCQVEALFGVEAIAPPEGFAAAP